MRYGYTEEEMLEFWDERQESHQLNKKHILQVSPSFSGLQLISDSNALRSKSVCCFKDGELHNEKGPAKIKIKIRGTWEIKEYYLHGKKIKFGTLARKILKRGNIIK